MTEFYISLPCTISTIVNFSATSSPKEKNNFHCYAHLPIDPYLSTLSLFIRNLDIKNMQSFNKLVITVRQILPFLYKMSFQKSFFLKQLAWKHSINLQVLFSLILPITDEDLLSF